MKILFATPRFPYPPYKGDQAVPYYRLRVLSEKHEITLLSMYQADEELRGIQHLSAFVKNICVVKLPRWQSILNMATRGPFSRLPLQALYYESPVFRKEFQRLLTMTSFDIVHAFMLRIVPQVSAFDGPKVLELIDSMQLNLKRRLEKEGAPWRWIYMEELRRVAPFERRVGSLFDEMVVVSETDRSFVEGENVSVIPLGVDSELFFPTDKPKHDAPTVIFSGNMGYAPNITAVKWFVEKCFSRIQAELPRVQFVVAGRDPSKEILALGRRDGVTVTGFVRAMPDALNAAHVAIAPMVSGSGMQFKILEAMASGLPVVTTRLGLGGIAARQNEEIVVCDDEGAFSEKVILLLRDPLLRKSIGSKAREFVMTNHAWSAAGTQIDKIYHRIIRN